MESILLHVPALKIMNEVRSHSLMYKPQNTLNVLYMYILLRQHIFWGAQCPKRYHKSSLCGPFEVEQLRGIKSSFITPKRYDEHPRHFLRKSPWGWKCSVCAILTLTHLSMSSPREVGEGHRVGILTKSV